MTLACYGALEIVGVIIIIITKRVKEVEMWIWRWLERIS